MPDLSSRKVTITLPEVLLNQVDRLAQHDYGNRSSVIRMALLQFVRQPSNKLVADPDSVAVAKLYQQLKAEHPHLDPDDATLIRFLYEQKITKAQV